MARRRGRRRRHGSRELALVLVLEPMRLQALLVLPPLVLVLEVHVSQQAR